VRQVWRAFKLLGSALARRYLRAVFSSMPALTAAVAGGSPYNLNSDI